MTDALRALWAEKGGQMLDQGKSMAERRKEFRHMLGGLQEDRTVGKQQQGMASARNCTQHGDRAEMFHCKIPPSKSAIN